MIRKFFNGKKNKLETQKAFFFVCLDVFFWVLQIIYIQILLRCVLFLEQRLTLLTIAADYLKFFGAVTPPVEVWSDAGDTLLETREVRSAGKICFTTAATFFGIIFDGLADFFRWLENLQQVQLVGRFFVWPAFPHYDLTQIQHLRSRKLSHGILKKSRVFSQEFPLAKYCCPLLSFHQEGTEVQAMGDALPVRSTFYLPIKPRVGDQPIGSVC